jgi:hypothetical protein
MPVAFPQEGYAHSRLAVLLEEQSAIYHLLACKAWSPEPSLLSRIERFLADVDGLDHNTKAQIHLLASNAEQFAYIKTHVPFLKLADDLRHLLGDAKGNEVTHQNLALFREYAEKYDILKKHPQEKAHQQEHGPSAGEVQLDTAAVKFFAAHADDDGAVRAFFGPFIALDDTCKHLAAAVTSGEALSQALLEGFANFIEDRAKLLSLTHRRLFTLPQTPPFGQLALASATDKAFKGLKDLASKTKSDSAALKTALSQLQTNLDKLSPEYQGFFQSPAHRICFHVQARLNQAHLPLYTDLQGLLVHICVDASIDMEALVALRRYETKFNKLSEADRTVYLGNHKIREDHDVVLAFFEEYEKCKAAQSKDLPAILEQLGTSSKDLGPIVTPLEDFLTPFMYWGILEHQPPIHPLAIALHQRSPPVCVGNPAWFALRNFKPASQVVWDALLRKKTASADIGFDFRFITARIHETFFFNLRHGADDLQSSRQAVLAGNEAFWANSFRQARLALKLFEAQICGEIPNVLSYLTMCRYQQWRLVLRNGKWEQMEPEALAELDFDEQTMVRPSRAR